MQGGLFGDAAPLPAGLLYREDFISQAEERELLAHIRELPFRAAAYREYTARRRVVRFGSGDYLEEGEEAGDFPRILFPGFLDGVRARVAAWLGVPVERLVHGLVTEYRPGTPIGWHRDAPHFGKVAGISLAGVGRMRFRPFDHRISRRPLTLVLAPRSAYMMQDEIRWRWEHSILPVEETRYSITLRTLA